MILFKNSRIFLEFMMLSSGNFKIKNDWKFQIFKYSMNVLSFSKTKTKVIEVNTWKEEISLKFGYNSRLNERTEAIQEYIRTIFSVITEIAV